MASDSFTPDAPATPVKKLVLCFDGTGNKFSGSSGDTNIVKLYHKFNRTDDDNQFHYYQTGIGTYDISSGSLNKGFFGSIKSSFSRTLDSAFATTFDAHVMAGYRFIMRHYDSGKEGGDQIYLFGFSRGAFTARFLARMINKVGLLSKGNEEMVSFAYDLYQRYEHGTHTRRSKPEDLKKDQKTKEEIKLNNEIAAFRKTFCREQKQTVNGQRQPVKIHFLGIFDCVSSVAVLDSAIGRTPQPLDVAGTAEHVRHAVAVDERRVKFKAALLNQDTLDPNNENEDAKEVWFPGNHGDVGGGWAPESQEDPSKSKMENWWSKVKSFFFGNPMPEPHPDTSKDVFQMSDIPLSWMIRELEDVEKNQPQANRISWNEEKDRFEENLRTRGIEQSLNAKRHDTLRLGGGSNFTKVLLWNLMECLPFLPRWELEKNKKSGSWEWTYERLKPNTWGTRDMPFGAMLHRSLVWHLEHCPGYAPKNDHGSGTEECLKAVKVSPVKEGNTNDKNITLENLHDIWTFSDAKTGPKSSTKNAPTTSVIEDNANPVAQEMSPPATPGTTPRMTYEGESQTSVYGSTDVLLPNKAQASGIRQSIAAVSRA